MSRIKSLLNTAFGERIDQPDFEFSQDTALNHAKQNVEGLVTGQNGYIVAGFLPSASGTVLTVNRNRSSAAATSDDVTGSAVLAFAGPEGTEYGHVLVDGDASRSIDIASFSDGTYNLWLSFSLRETDFENRSFWNANPTSGSPVEFQRNVPTRRAADWNFQLLVETQAAGDEFIQIAQVTKAGTVVTVADRRQLFLEGQVVPATGTAYDPGLDWGTGSTRDANRAQFGLRDIRTGFRALQRQLALILGQNWWEVPSNPLPDKLNRDGSNTITGVLVPDGTLTRDLGSSTARFLQFFARNIVLDGSPSAALTGAENVSSERATLGPPSDPTRNGARIAGNTSQPACDVIAGAGQPGLTVSGAIRDVLQVNNGALDTPAGMVFNGSDDAADQSYIFNTPGTQPGSGTAITIQAGQADTIDSVVLNAGSVVGSSAVASLTLTNASGNLQAPQGTFTTAVTSRNFTFERPTIEGRGGRVIAARNFIGTSFTPPTSTTLNGAMALTSGNVVQYDLGMVIPVGAQVRNILLSATAPFGSGSTTVDMDVNAYANDSTSTVVTNPGSYTGAGEYSAAGYVHTGTERLVLEVTANASTTITQVFIEFDTPNILP